MEFSKRIQEIKAQLRNKGWKYADLAMNSGIPLSTILKVLSGNTRAPRIDTVEAIERALGLGGPAVALPKRDPFHSENIFPVSDIDLFPIPLLGEVVAGVPIEAQQNLEGYIYISHRPAEDYFALRVHGDSMKNVGITDKSIIICRKQETAESGEIVVAMLNGEQTVKRYKLHGGAVFLMPENSDYLPIPVTPADDFLILGKVVEIRITV